MRLNSPATQIAPKDSIPTKEMAAKRETETIDEPDAIGLNITSGEVDTFDHILEVTSHHEAVYAYYYMDENNKVSRRSCANRQLHSTFH